jgi:hypothetical protein
MKRLLIFSLAIGSLVYVGLNRSESVNAAVADQRRPDLTAIFNSNYQQYIDEFGTVARAAFDGSGKRIGTQVGTYRAGAPNGGMVVEMTYLEPDVEHPLGQAFDSAGNPMPLHTGVN